MRARRAYKEHCPRCGKSPSNHGKAHYQSGRPASYGELERLAGVGDRLAFWKDKTEPAARLALAGMIAARVAVGELCLCYGEPR